VYIKREKMREGAKSNHQSVSHKGEHKKTINRKKKRKFASFLEGGNYYVFVYI